MKSPSLKTLAMVAAAVVLLHAAPASSSWRAASTSLGQRVHASAAYANTSYTVGAELIPQFAMTVLVVRNADPDTPIRVNTVKFYSASGALVKSLLPAPRTLAPLAAVRIELTPATLGIPYYSKTLSACSVIVEWQATKPVTPAVVSSVMYLVRPEGDGAVFLAEASLPTQVVDEREVP